MRLALVVLALSPTVVQAQAIRDSTIAVSATKVTRIAPDRATMYVLVEGTAETPADAVTRVETKLKAVSDALKALGSSVEPDRAITYSVGPTPQPNVYPGSVVPQSNISRAVLRVSMNRIDQIARTAAGALAAGASGVSTITFESTVADSVRRSRMTEVLGVARADALALATALNGKLGGLVDVTSTAGNIAFAGPNMLNFETRFMQPTQVPEVTITTSVNVRYRLIQ